MKRPRTWNEDVGFSSVPLSAQVRVSSANIMEANLRTLYGQRCCSGRCVSQSQAGLCACDLGEQSRHRRPPSVVAHGMEEKRCIDDVQAAAEAAHKHGARRLHGAATFEVKVSVSSAARVAGMEPPLRPPDGAKEPVELASKPAPTSFTEVPISPSTSLSLRTDTAFIVRTLVQSTFAQYVSSF